MKYLVPVEPAPSLGEQSPILRLAFKVSGNPAPSMLLGDFSWCTEQSPLTCIHSPWVYMPLFSLPLKYFFFPLYAFNFSLTSPTSGLVDSWPSPRLIKGGSSFPQSSVLLIWYRLVIGLHSLNFVSVIVKVQETPELKKNLWTRHFELNWTRFKLLLQVSCSIHTRAIIICHF